jgi:nitroreductase
VELEEAVRTRRTHKAYGSEPVPRAVLEELFELATWAPNHHLTNPWRFRVLGPQALARLTAAADAQAPGSGAKLARAPTLVAVSTLADEDPVVAEEDHSATAVAAYLVLLGAHARGYAAYWRTPAVLRDAGGRAALGLPAGERALGLLHLGTARQEPPVPARAAIADVARFLD